MEYRRPRVLVLGDLMFDMWFHGRARHANPEGAAMILTGRQEDRDSTLGGAGLVAVLLKTLGLSVKVLGCVGADYPGSNVHNLLHESDLGCKGLVIQEDMKTPVKVRFLNEHGVVAFRYDEEMPAEELLEQGSPNFDFDKFTRYVQKADCVVVADYGKGFCQAYGEKIIEAARYYGALTVVGAKPAVLDNYRGADIVKVNASEAADYVRRCDGVVPHDRLGVSAAFARATGARASVITGGAHGSVYSLWQPDDNYQTFQAAAKPCFPVILNCVGAGDAFLAGLVAELMLSPKMRSVGFKDRALEATRLHTAVASGAACAAQYLNRGYLRLDPATPYLASFQRRVEDSAAAKLVSGSDATLLCAAWHSQDEAVVFANGCFDLLHSGHVRLLEEAKKQGARLVVAVNSDASVRLLKGPDRPVQDFQTRSRVIANLGCVDAVVELDEEDFSTNPALRALITAFHPDVLVKGAEYEESQIVGWEEMVNRESPGRVWRCPMLDGVSTTRLVEKVQQNGKR